jgi:peptide/nickel transport system substrate-binding protein
MNPTNAALQFKLGHYPNSVSFFLFMILLVCATAGCFHATQRDPSSLTFLIESSPTNLDPRFATDSQSQRIDGLLFGSLLERDNQMNFHGDLAESWSTPDPLTYVFHLRRGVRFHDGRPLNASDVKATFDFLMNPANKSPKRGASRLVTSIDAPDDATVIFHLGEPYASFPGNLIRPTTGIVPANAGADFSRHPIGSGPFRFVQQTQDEDVVVERNSDYFHGAPQLARVRFRVVPDAVVRALELRKGSADLEMTSLSGYHSRSCASARTGGHGSLRNELHLSRLQSRRSGLVSPGDPASPRVRYRPRNTHPISTPRPGKNRLWRSIS